LEKQIRIYEEILLTMRNLKCEVFDDEILVPELTKQQKEITKILKIIVPKVWEFRMFRYLIYRN